ncbi:MAG: carbohydrate kinase family protein, partial [Promethearchaeota archaeon]
DNLELLSEVIHDRIDILFINKRDATFLVKNPDLDAADNVFLKFARIRIYTLGSEGAIIKSDYCDNVKIPIFEVNVIDRTGAGDAFAAGVLIKCHEIIDKTGPFIHHLQGLNEKQRVAILKSIGQFGSAIAALKVSLARTPSRSELNSFVEERIDGGI